MPPDDLAFSSESGTFMTGGAAAAPEPAAWAMMLAGFGLVGLTLRGRRKRLCDFAERVCTI